MKTLGVHVTTDPRALIAAADTALGIEFGSTRIKAVLIGPDHEVLATGGHAWENHLEGGLWSYTLDEAVATILVNLSSQPASLGEVARGVSGELILSNRDLSEAEREAPGVLEPWEARVYLA